LSEDDEEGTDIEHSLDTDEQENSDPNILDPYDKVYANVPLESHMLPSVPNCKHATQRNSRVNPPDSVIEVERFIFQLQRHHQSS
jgi:hypothetical protein